MEKQYALRSVLGCQQKLLDHSTGWCVVSLTVRPGKSLSARQPTFRARWTSAMALLKCPFLLKRTNLSSRHQLQTSKRTSVSKTRCCLKLKNSKRAGWTKTNALRKPVGESAPIQETAWLKAEKLTIFCREVWSKTLEASCLMLNPISSTSLLKPIKSRRISATAFQIWKLNTGMKSSRPATLLQLLQRLRMLSPSCSKRTAWSSLIF